MNYTQDDLIFLRDLSTKVRAHVLVMAHKARSSHVGSSLSAVDLIVALYGKIMHVDSSLPSLPSRDRFILSKGHACAAVYAILAEKGFFPKSWLDTYQDEGSRLLKHIAHSVPGVEASTGSLGHGLAIACGMSLAAKRDRQPSRVFALLSDGECDEGSTWEAALFAPHHRLDNLVVIVDYNKIQAFGRVKDVLNLDPLPAKWQAFGWSVLEVDGHSFPQILQTLSAIPFTPGKPSCVIAHTIKGKGVTFMENELSWHYRYPNDEELIQALGELGVEL